MVATTPAPRIRIARLALFAVFGLNGFLAAVWIVHIPAVTRHTGVTPTTLGMLILLMAAFAIAGMQAAGPLADRFGSRALTAAAATLLSLALLGPAFAGSPATLALALTAFGLGNGALDVSMNAQAVHVERAYPRPIMSAFHAFFSCGGFLGSVLGAATQNAHWNIHLTFGLATGLGLAVVAVAAPRLASHAEFTTGARTSGATAVAQDAGSPKAARHNASGCRAAGTGSPAGTGNTPEGDLNGAPAASAPPSPFEEITPRGLELLGHAEKPEPRSEEGVDRGGATGHRADDRHGGAPAVAGAAERRHTSRRSGGGRKVLLLGVIAFALLMAEGVAADWSALQVRDRLAVEAGTAGLAYAGFAATMTLGRFGADRVSARFGRVAIVRWGTALAAIGFGVIAVSGWLPLTLAGWALCGAGLSGCVPQVFTAAGNLGDGVSATDMSRVFGLGYVGLLAGPAIIGWLDKLVPLTTSMVVPTVAMLLCAWAARAVSPQPAAPH